MVKKLKARAEQEADRIGSQFAYSSDVVADMSRAYHVDFSNIQFHTDENAERKVKSAGMDGMAQGNHLFFGRGIFKSNAPEDKMLLAHELVHTMQQGVVDGGNAVSEHVPMGTIQYCGRVRKTRFDSDTQKSIREEADVEDNVAADPNYENTEEDDDDYDEIFESIAGRGYELHHYATNKNSYYTPLFQAIVEKYGLDLDGWWNKKRLPHHGRHTIDYHQFVYEKMLEIDEQAQQRETEFGQKLCFLIQFYFRVKKVINENPGMLYLQN